MNERIYDKWPKEFNKDDAFIKGVSSLAIQKALQFGTPLVIKENGKIKEISPAAMKRKLAKHK